MRFISWLTEMWDGLTWRIMFSSGLLELADPDGEPETPPAGCPEDAPTDDEWEDYREDGDHWDSSEADDDSEWTIIEHANPRS